MNESKELKTEIARQYEAMKDADIVAPGSLALGAYRSFATGEEPPVIQWASMQHVKHLAREYLRRHDDRDDSPAYQEQGELDGIRFSGQLQDRYPLPRKAGDDPVYKRRLALTPEERHWNAEQLRKSAGARLEHADALEAEGLNMLDSA